jgi:hypothetical protein
MQTTMTRNKAIQTAASTSPPTTQFKYVLPSSYLNATVFETATISSAARIAYANLNFKSINTPSGSHCRNCSPIHPTNCKTNTSIKISSWEFHYRRVHRHKSSHFSQTTYNRRDYGPHENIGENGATRSGRRQRTSTAKEQT